MPSRIQSRLPDVADDRVAQGPYYGLHLGLLEHLARDLARELVEQTRKHPCQLGRPCFRFDARTQPTDRLEVEVADARASRVEPERDPEPGRRGGIVKVVRHHAHDLALDAVDDEPPADDVRVAAELSSPEGCRQDRDLRGTRSIVLRAERTSAHRRRAQRGEQARRDAGSDDALGRRSLAAVRAEVHVGDAVGADVLERARRVALIQQKRRVRLIDLRDPGYDDRVREGDEPVRVGEGQRPEQDPVDDTEHGGRRSDPQREHEHHGGGEARCGAKPPECIARVLLDRSQELESLHAPLPFVTDGDATIPDLVEIAEALECRVARGLRIEARPLEQLGAHGEVVRELVVDVAFGARAPEPVLAQPVGPELHGALNVRRASVIAQRACSATVRGVAASTRPIVATKRVHRLSSARSIFRPSGVSA